MGRTFPKLGIVGCGAIVESFYLAALKRMGWRPVVIVDPASERARKVASRFKTDWVAHELDQEILDGIEVAIVATPHSLHAPIAVRILESGRSVFLEKPMATSSAECSGILSAANRCESIVSVALLRRFMQSHRWVRSLIRSGSIGDILAFDFRVGSVFSWPLKTDSLWRRESAGGGVLMDIGAHICDLVIWWFGNPSSLNYKDDSFGGVEADCLLEMETREGGRGVVELSRTRNLRNTAVVKGTKGTVELYLGEEEVSTEPENLLDAMYEGRTGRGFARCSVDELIEAALNDWLAAVTEGTPTRSSGVEAARSVDLIERCYRDRKQWELPWTHIAKE